MRFRASNFPPGTGSAAAAPSGRPPATILAVDDDRAILGTMARRLTQLGHRTVLSDTAAEALDLIAARGFDLVLLDTEMPRMSGMQVLREIRGSRATADLPVIMLTGRSNPAAAVEALAEGADDHLAKPFAFEVLAARIDRVLARARRIAELKRANASLDARVVARAIELGETRSALAATHAERQRLAASIAALSEQVERLARGGGGAPLHLAS